MPISKFIASEKQKIESFLVDKELKLLRLGVDPEAEVMVVRLLSAIDSNPRNRDVFIGFEHSFEKAESFYQQALAKISEEHRKVQAELDRQGIQFSIADQIPGGKGLVEARFAEEMEKLALALKERTDHLVLVFSPMDRADHQAYCTSLRSILDCLKGDRIKLIALDRCSPPQLGSVEEGRKDVVGMAFHISPDVIEQGVKDELAKSSCPPLLRMRYLTTLVGFAMARKDFAVALRLGQEVLEYFSKEGDPREEAAAAFNLGNVCYRKEDYEQSRVHHEYSLRLALEHDMYNLTEQNLINIGNTWFMVGEFKHALSYYQGALRWSNAIQNPFGRCQALDLIGMVHQREGRPSEARNAWEEALEIYRGMDQALSQMAKAGEEQTLARLAAIA